jgi:toxin secretion/phage lysis holin
MTGSNHETTEQIAFMVGLKWAYASITGIVASLWVTIPSASRTLIILMAFDYVSGLLGAWSQKKLCSREGFRGIAKKLLMLLLVAAAHFIAAPLQLGMDAGVAVAIALSVNEAISIVENCNEAGVPIPSVLLDVLAKAKQLTGRGKSAEDVRKALEASAGEGGKP